MAEVIQVVENVDLNVQAKEYAAEMVKQFVPFLSKDDLEKLEKQFAEIKLNLLLLEARAERYVNFSSSLMDVLKMEATTR